MTDGVRILGVHEAEAYLERLRAGAVRIDGVSIRIGSNKPWMWGLEFGRHRNGQLARRKGGTRALTGGLQSVQAEIPGEVVAGLEEGGPEGAYRRLMGLAMRVRNYAREHTPVITGESRRSVQIVAERTRRI